MDRCSTLKMISEPPHAPSDLHLIAATDESIKLGWRSPKFDGGSSILFYYIEACQSGTNIWKQVAQVSRISNTLYLKKLLSTELK